MTTALAEELREAQALQGLGLLIWWTPSRIAFYQSNKWKTLHYPHYTPILASAKEGKSKAISPSPVDVAGQAHYIAFDCDYGPEQVRKLVAALPPGCVPLVSRSGGRGGEAFHLWLFLSEPVPVQTAVSFARAVLLRSGVRCEYRPTGVRSLCLKWPGQKHPETGKREVFVHEDDLTGDYDSEAVLQMLAEGYYRTPAAIIEDYVRRHSGKAVPVANAPKAQTKPSRQVEAGHWLETFKDEQAGFRLLELFGKRVRVARLRQGFRCPIHSERRPSGSFVKDANGFVAFHDWHHEKHGLGSEFFTLPELYTALKTGSELRKLDRREQAAAAKELAFLLGFTNGTVKQIITRWLHSTQTLLALGLLTHLIFKRLVITPREKDWFQALKLNGLTDFEKVWVMCLWCFIQDAMDGKEETAMSKRFVGERTGVKYWLVNRIMNLLCTLGLLEKCEVVKHGPKLGADRYRLGNVGFEEAKRRFEALFPNGQVDLRAFKRELVAAKLGPELAAKVFRREAETRSASKFDTQVDTQPDTELSLPLPEAARANPFVAAIKQAEREGSQERVDALLRGLAAWLAAGRPENVAAYLQGGYAR